VITELERAYLAGFIDGEGCISIIEQRRTNSPMPSLHVVVAVSSCEKTILDYWAEKTGLGSVNLSTKARGNSRNGYLWQVSARKAMGLLVMVYPYLILKKPQADVAFDFQETIYKNWDGKRLNPEILAERFRFKDELTRLKGTTKAGRPRIHDSRRPAPEMAALLGGE